MRAMATAAAHWPANLTTNSSWLALCRGEVDVRKKTNPASTHELARILNGSKTQ